MSQNTLDGRNFKQIVMKQTFLKQSFKQTSSEVSYYDRTSMLGIKATVNFETDKTQIIAVIAPEI